MKESLKKESVMVKVFINSKMEINMKVFGKMIRDMDKVNLHGKQENYMRVNGIMILCMVLDTLERKKL